MFYDCWRMLVVEKFGYFINTWPKPVRNYDTWLSTVVFTICLYTFIISSSFMFGSVIALRQ